MKGIILFTALAMSAGVAYAQPSPRVDARVQIGDDARVQIRDDAGWTRDRYDRYDRSHWARDYRGRWTALARGFSAQTNRQFIPVRGQQLRKLRIEADRGAPVIAKIAIEFRDGTSQAVDLDMRLARGTGEVIDLNGGVRRVQRIIVYADPRSRGSYSVYGG